MPREFKRALTFSVLADLHCCLGASLIVLHGQMCRGILLFFHIMRQKWTLLKMVYLYLVQANSVAEYESEGKTVCGSQRHHSYRT